MKEGNKLGKVIVAVTGRVNDWAAYELDINPITGEMPTLEQVASVGDKINRETAEKLFPVMNLLGLEWRD